MESMVQLSDEGTHEHRRPCAMRMQDECCITYAILAQRSLAVVFGHMLQTERGYVRHILLALQNVGEHVTKDVCCRLR